MKDPCQHLNFENLKKSGKISFWIKHTGQMEQEPCSLIVANLTYRAATGGDSEQASSHSSSKRAELRLPLVKPVQVGSKCATGKKSVGQSSMEIYRLVCDYVTWFRLISARNSRTRINF